MGDIDFYRSVRCECSKCSGIIVCGERNLLPTAVRPTNYKLKLQPDLAKHTYGGCVAIAMECYEDCSTITLHSNEIDIKTALIQLDGGEPAECAVVGYDKDEQTATLFAAVKKGQKGVLTLHFTGILNDQLAGFYRTKYTTSDGEARRIVASGYCGIVSTTRLAATCAPPLRAKCSVRPPGAPAAVGGALVSDVSGWLRKRRTPEATRRRDISSRKLT